MASRMIGRAPCPECGFSAAHVKQSEKCLYRYCPECGAQYNSRGERQRADLMAKTRLVEAPAGGSPGELPAPSATASATPTAPAAAPALPETPEATPTAPSASAKAGESKPKRRGLFL